MTKILVVDDENLLLYSLSSTLKHDGAEVMAVPNGKDALREIHAMPYDICFLDVHLPDANGLDLMKVMREISPKTRIIIMTAVELDEGQLKLLSNNGIYYLPKPFDLEEIRSLVQRVRKSDDPRAIDA